MNKKNFIDVAVDMPLNKAFTYKVPETLSMHVDIGKRVLVPFGKKIITGFCTGFREKPDVRDVKDIIDILDEEPVFDEKRLKLFQWIASYYFAPLGEVLGLTCPAGSGIKSHRHLFANNTASASCGVDLSRLDRDILDVVVKKTGITIAALLKLFKGRAVYNAVSRLKGAGLIREELKIKGMIGERLETFASISELNLKSQIPNSKSQVALPPIQAKVIAYLSENGETALKILRKKLGNIGHTVKRLEQRGLVSLMSKRIPRDPMEDISPQTISHNPTHEQEKAINAIFQALNDKTFSPFLLHGVTGSGKTLVYLKAVEQTVKLGRQAIFLVPEISLTSWPAKYLAAMFPGRVAVLHSGLSDGERFDEWRRIKGGKANVIIGARSALFAPLKTPGLIIIDEEHEPSYKQEEGVRYNARDLSLMMGKMFNLTVVLGSATPSIETFYNAKNGKITPLHLTKRVENRPMPEIELVDMKRMQIPRKKQTMNPNFQIQNPESETPTGGIISERLKGLMKRNLSLGQQTILFLNRRGFSSFIICNDCGYTFQCLNCSISLTVHRMAGLLKCHYCDMSLPIPSICPRCHGQQIKPIGLGTQQVEEETRKIFDRARVARMDRDTTRRKRAHQKILDAVDKGDVDVLVGTQMVAKGHDFPNVTVVGIVQADTSINIPDFRSSERTFQLISQAAGRAGRGAIPGEVIVQTLNPGHFCLKHAAEHNYEGFFEDELANRKELLYPPFSRIINLRFEGNKEEYVEAAAKKAKETADSLLKDLLIKDIVVLGPAPAFLSKIRGKYRWQMLLKGKSTKSLHEFAAGLLKGFEEKKDRRVKLIVDVDPINTI